MLRRVSSSLLLAFSCLSAASFGIIAQRSPEKSPDENKQESDRQAKDIARSNEEGRAALSARDWDTAIEKFSSGVRPAPDDVSGTAVLLIGKLIAQKSKAYDIYLSGIAAANSTLRRERIAAANSSYDDALTTFKQAIDILTSARQATDSAEKKKRANVRLELYSNAVEIHRIKVINNIDTTKGSEAARVYAEYVAIEADPARKLSAQLGLGDIMRLTGDFDKAAAAYRDALTTKPDHAEAMAGLGLSLFAAGAAASPEDTKKEQEGLIYMQKYIAIAPLSETDSQAVKDLKVSIKQAVEYMRSQNIAPQKVDDFKKKP